MALKPARCKKDTIYSVNQRFFCGFNQIENCIVINEQEGFPFWDRTGGRFYDMQIHKFLLTLQKKFVIIIR